MSEANANEVPFLPVILAGGSGTRFWPRSRRARAKQVLALSGEETMIQQTAQRLLPMASPEHFLVVTNNLLADTIVEQLPGIPRSRILREPVARNTAPACALAAMIALREHPDPGRGIRPSHPLVVTEQRFPPGRGAAIRSASAGDNIVVLGAPPTRPETGYGYIEEGHAAIFPGLRHTPVADVQCFTEKPDLQHAEEFLRAGNFRWNSGMFFWSAKTLVNALHKFCPAMVPPLQTIADAFDTPAFDRVFAELYPAVESISIDYAVLEPRSRLPKGTSQIYCIPADFGWNDLGSWSALHEYFLQHIGKAFSNGNVVEADGTLQLDSTGNYVYAPGLTVALLGVQDLVVVQTDDALLVTTRSHSQEVGRVVAELVKHSRHELV